MTSKTQDGKTAFGKFIAKFQEKPTFYIGSAGLTTIVGAGLYGLRSRKIRLSLYLINLRLAAQGTFVGILTVGIGYMLIKRHLDAKPVEFVEPSSR